MTNRYAARCTSCGARVPRHGGVLTRRPGGGWDVQHLACAKTDNDNQRQVVTVTIGGKSYIQNTHGRCIDAPCCGCCTA